MVTQLVVVSIGVSACLLGEPVRYDGTDRRHDRLISVLGAEMELIPVCPEVELGLGVPRPPIDLVPGRSGGVRLVTLDGGTDLTARMDDYARDRVRRPDLAGISGYVFKSKSPSCGLSRQPRGRFADALVRAYPDLPVIEERDLDDDDTLADFASRVRSFRARSG